MGESGYVRAHGELNEEIYVREFARIVETAVDNGAESHREEPTA
jgi:hypothetical protein